MSWYFKEGTTPMAPGETLGVADMSGSFKSFKTELIKFRLAGAAIDADPLWPFEAQVTIFDPNGNQFFYGWVTKLPVKGSGKEENQYYELSGPWYWFEKLLYQQEWASWDGLRNVLVSTLQTMTIINQAEDGTLLDLGQVVTAILNFLLVAGAANVPPFVPFSAGLMVPDTEIPFTNVASQMCAQAIVTVFQWVPDAVGWFDHTMSPPVFNVSRRANLVPVNLPAFNADGTAVDLTPRYDLLVKAVVCKYQQTNTVAGVTYRQQYVDIFPVGSPDPAFGNLVLNLDLLGGHLTFQKQAITTTDRPKDYNATKEGAVLSAVTLPWLKTKDRADFLKSYTIPAGTDPDQVAYGSPGNATLNDIVVNVDETKFTVLSVVTTLSENSPALVLPTGTVNPGEGPGTNLATGGNALDYLGQELLKGSVTPWMTKDKDIFEANVKIDIVLQYTGDDPVIQALFSAGPTYLKKISASVNVTNGQTQTYSEPTSGTPPEPVPVGLAQTLYEGFSVLHYQGSIELTEIEASQQVKLCNVVNLTGGRPEWAAMNAVVEEIEINFDKGTTRVNLGPPVELTGQQLVDILRADRGRIQSWQRQERQSGIAGDDNAVQGTGSNPIVGTTLPPSMLPSAPWRVLWRHGPGNVLQAMVTSGNLYNLQGSAPALIPVDNLNTWVTCTPAVPGGDAFWIEGTVQADPIAPSGATMRSIGQGDNDFDPTGATASWDASGKGDLVNDGASPPNQTKFRALLATVTADGNGNPVIKATRSQDLVLKNKNVNGEPCIFPEPYGN